MGVKYGLGHQDYEKMMSDNIFYIDKTDFISEWWNSGDLVTLITRPRRFGKTLNMNTVKCFFSNEYEGKGSMFEGRKVWEDEELRKLQGTYPVIFMSFAGVKLGSDASADDDLTLGRVEYMKTSIKRLMELEYGKFRNIMQSDIFNDSEREYFASVKKDMSDETASTSIRTLSMYLERYYGKKAIILLDEYDTPMQEAWVGSYWEAAVAFLRGFFVNTFKDNPGMERGLITGITRISKESVFSNLNHIMVVTTTSDEYATSFGFTEDEVFKALDDAGLGSHKEGVKKWYDGFTFGKHTDIYNPWSLISFIKSSGKYIAYWANTSSNDLISALIQKGDAGVKKIVEDLLAGKSFRAPIDEQIVFNRLSEDVNAVWSLFLASGYLKVVETEPFAGDRTDDVEYTLTLTNLEVLIMLKKMIAGWFKINAAGSTYNNFVKAMLMDDVEYMNSFMNTIALNSFSSFDVARGASENNDPERFYHGFVLGLMVGMQDGFEITSNRESGFGRYDIMLKPYDREKNNAYIIEFKVFRASKEKNLEDTVANALLQIEEKQYEAALIASGFAPEKIRKYGFAFQGKTCLIGK